MGGFFKLLSSALGILAVIVCLATVGIIVYTSFNPQVGGSASVSSVSERPSDSVAAATPSGAANGSDLSLTELVEQANHIHDYKETIDLQATCTSPGRIRYLCDCGDYYYAETPTVDHEAGRWEIVVPASETSEGLRVLKCIYCDLPLSEEVIAADSSTAGGAEHVHEYISAVESEATCTMAGIRKYMCSCGSYYRENIPARGHVVGDWEVAEEATTSARGFRQRICNVCNALIDYREIEKLAATPSPSSGSSPNPSATPTAKPTATPHTHAFSFMVLQEATCSGTGIEVGNCSCGAENQRIIDKNPDAHKFSVRRVEATDTEAGYIEYLCMLCGYSKRENN